MIQKEILKKIKEFERIIITMHMRPDGDCTGAAFGLKDILKTSFPQKEIYVVGEEAEYVKFLGRVDEVSDEKFSDALIIAVDTATSDRIADQRFKLGKYLIKIDHHLPVEDYGMINYVDTTACAASQIIFSFYNMFKKKLKISPNGLAALYTGIVTDSGRFKYRSVSGDTFRSIASMVDMGLDFAPILEKLDVKTEEMLKLKGYVLFSYEKTPNGVAYIKITPEILAKYNVSLEEATSLVNELSVIEDSPVWALFAEYDGNFVRGRLRSRGPAINELANKYNGGGHAMACGVSLETWDNVNKLLEDADLLVKEYKINKGL